MKKEFLWSFLVRTKRSIKIDKPDILAKDQRNKVNLFMALIYRDHNIKNFISSQCYSEIGIEIESRLQ